MQGQISIFGEKSSTDRDSRDQEAEPHKKSQVHQAFKTKNTKNRYRRGVSALPKIYRARKDPPASFCRRGGSTRTIPKITTQQLSPTEIHTTHGGQREA